MADVTVGAGGHDTRGRVVGLVPERDPGVVGPQSEEDQRDRADRERDRRDLLSGVKRREPIGQGENPEETGDEQRRAKEKRESGRPPLEVQAPVAAEEEDRQRADHREVEEQNRERGRIHEADFPAPASQAESSARRTLRVVEYGRGPGWSTTRVGRLCGARSAALCSTSRTIAACPAVRSAGTMTAQTSSETARRPSCAIAPRTATSAKSALVARAASTSSGCTFKPLPRTTTFLTRPVIERKPSASRWPRSPVFNQPSSSILARVASSSPR